MAKVDLDHLLPDLLKAGDVDGVIKVLREGRATVELQNAIADMLESKETPRLDVVNVNAGVKLHQPPEQMCTALHDLAGVKVHHLA